MNRLAVMAILVLALAGRAQAQNGRIEIKATGSASAPANWEPTPGGPGLPEMLRLQAIAMAMKSARAQAESLTQAGGLPPGGILDVQILPDAPHGEVSLTNASTGDSFDGRRAFWMNTIGTQFSRGATATSAEITVSVEFGIGYEHSDSKQ